MEKTRRQGFHLEPPAGLLNDPNGLVWYRGSYYVYFQWNKFEKNHSYKEWGSFASDDLIHWQFRGSALVPDQPYDQNGVYSAAGWKSTANSASTTPATTRKKGGGPAASVWPSQKMAATT